MKCPACKRPLRERGVGEFTVDTCHGGCGGIWFDVAELELMNDRAAAALHRVWQHPQREVEHAAERLCPRCPGKVLERKWFSEAKKVEIDQCPQCAGIWLDDGEFTTIREELKSGQAAGLPWARALTAAITLVEADPGSKGKGA